MTEDFTGKVALVTGGGNGIGAATCRAFAAAGAQVAVLDRDAAAAEAVAAEITGRNGHAAAYALDVADRDAFARLAEGITEAWGGIDILVNGAGTTVRRMIGEMGAEDWERVIAVNLTGAFNGIQAVLPHMRARGGGAIVNIASIAGQRISFGGTANYYSLEGRSSRLDAPRRLRARPRRDPGQRRLPGSDRDGVRRRDPIRRDEGGAGAQDPARAACASPRISPTRSCFWPVTRRA